MWNKTWIGTIFDCVCVCVTRSHRMGLFVFKSYVFEQRQQFRTIFLVSKRYMDERLNDRQRRTYEPTEMVEAFCRFLNVNFFFFGEEILTVVRGSLLMVVIVVVVWTFSSSSSASSVSRAVITVIIKAYN